LTAAGNGKQIHDQIRDLVAEIQKTEKEALDARQSRARRSATMTRAVIVAGTAIGFIVVAIALFLIGQDFAGNRQAEAALREAHDELEARVQERTAELEHSNESLREAEAVLRTVTDAAHVGLAIIDQERRCRYANPGYSEILDLPAEEIVGQRLAHVRAPGDAETVPDRLEAAFGGEHVNFELSVPPAAPGDTERYYAVSYEPATSRWGKVVIIVMMDMTERKRAQLTLSRYRLLAGQTRDIILFTREDGQIMEANDAAVKTYGYDYETLLSKSIYDLGADLTFPVVDQQMTAADRAGLRFETIHRREDGSRFPVDVTSVGADFGGERLLLSIIRDITDRKRTEEELRQQAALLDLAPVFVRDLASRVVLWGQGAQQLYGYSREEALGQSSHELLRSEFPVPLAEIEDTLKRQGSWEGELTHRTRDGSRMVVSSHWVLYYDTRGIATHVMEVNTDVTLRKEVEEDIKKWNLRLEERVKERTAELREAKERAELADRVKSEFLANMSHELRTPLNAVIGFSELLTDQKPGPLNSQQQDFLNEILMSGRHLLSLINDILDLTRITAGKIDLQPRALSVSAAVRESCSTIKPIASEKNILVKVKTDSKNDIVNLDELRLKQVLYNLLSNAVKFTPQNGKIRVAASVDDQKRIRIRVKDTGIGINEQDLPRLFGVFQQGDSGFAKRQQGSGLGLALTKKIVELQNGAITVESEPGKGSTFTVVLPSNAHVEGEAAVS
jgi:PAS domain S-box-containing protein